MTCYCSMRESDGGVLHRYHFEFVKCAFELRKVTHQPESYVLLTWDVSINKNMYHYAS